MQADPDPGGHPMATWAQFAAAEPELAAYGWELLREEQGYAFLATVDRRGAPRVHPVVPFVAEGRLLVSIAIGSPKARDLRAEPEGELILDHSKDGMKNKAPINLM